MNVNQVFEDGGNPSGMFLRVNVNAVFERPILVFCLLFLESWRCGCRGAAAAGANSFDAAAATAAAAETELGCLGRWWRSKLCRGKTTVFPTK